MTVTRRAGATDVPGGPVAPDAALRLVALGHPAATDASRVGTKAAALARSAAAGLPVLPGVVVPAGADPGEVVVDEIRAALGEGVLIARSSSALEDREQSSMAGWFTSVPDLADDGAVVDAIATVARSGEAVVTGSGRPAAVAPVAVLVQPMLDVAVGGVAFGVDPVSGRADRRVIVASADGPSGVVGGRVDGVRHVLDRRGRLLDRLGDDRVARLPAARRREVLGLVERCGELMGSPQDVEWAVDHTGRLWLLQSRPVTTAVVGAPAGPRYGTGPVAETFPHRLAPLEVDLWVVPLRDGMVEALRLAALASPVELQRHPPVVDVGGWVAADLDRVGAHADRRRRWRSPDPAGWWRRARATWRVGRLRAALPGLARDVVDDADAALGWVAPPGGLTDEQLLGVARRARAALRSLHGHEILMGLLVEDARVGPTGVGAALRALAAGRLAGMDDDEIVARSPVVLALCPPSLEPVRLPERVELPPALPPPGAEAAVLREALRLRARWVQELSAVAVRELGRRLSARRQLPDAGLVGALRLEELVALVTASASPVPAALATAVAADRMAPSPAPPGPFRLDAEGRVVPEPVAEGDGVGAGGGTGTGPVRLDPATAGPGDVLVVRDLSPDLAPVVARLGGLVAESGSPLAHLAILAREAAVPTVVGLPGATRRFRPGQWVVVDGASGAVHGRDEGEGEAA